jgi:D-glycero-D-manno-heptose 1,7-bisphosphate phosphatase
MNSNKAIFLDRDGVIIKKAPDGDYIKTSEETFILPGALEAIAWLNKQNFLIIEITNQRGIGKKKMTVKDFNSITKKIDEEMKKVNAHIDAIYY